MTQTKQTLKNTSRVWKMGDGWVQHNPPHHHPCYEEWMKLKQQKEKYNDK
jgi:hypothetical protein